MHTPGMLMGMDSITTDRDIRVYYDIPYRNDNEAHERHRGDLYLPAESDGAPLALIIHGGGWQAMDKNSFAGVAEFFAQQGYAAFATNYRLLKHAPYPACYDDCMAAADFICNGDLEMLSTCDRSSLLVCGGSAGGHLALMTGLTFIAKPVRGIVSIAGPADLRVQLQSEKYAGFFATDRVSEAMMLEASPVHYVTQDSPSLLCTHASVDPLVSLDQAQALIARYQECGARGELYTYEPHDQGHSIWPAGHECPIDGPEGRMNSGLKHLMPHLEERISTFLHTL